jgi:hypothetical protein
MTFFRTIAWGLAGGIGGLLLGAVLGNILASVLRVPAREAGAGLFAGAIAVAGGILGTIIAMVVALHSRGVSFFHIALGALAMLGCLGIVFGAWSYWFQNFSQLNFKHTYYSALLKFEIRLPAGEDRPDGLSGFAVTLQDGGADRDAVWEESQPQKVDGHTVLAGQIYLYEVTFKRLLTLRLPNGETRVFKVRLPANPKRSRLGQWSKWTSPDGQNGAAPTDKNYVIRYQVAK